MKPEQPKEATAADVRERALALLARREHSHRELQGKLGSRGFATDFIDEVLAQLSAEGLLSNRRFAEQYVRSRIGRGVGPVRIRAELYERGVDENIINIMLGGQAGGLRTQLEQVRQKRFGYDLPVDMKERARQTRFLQQRGFPVDLVNRVLGDRD